METVVNLGFRVNPCKCSLVILFGISTSNQCSLRGLLNDLQTCFKMLLIGTKKKCNVKQSLSRAERIFHSPFNTKCHAPAVDHNVQEQKFHIYTAVMHLVASYHHNNSFCFEKINVASV